MMKEMNNDCQQTLFLEDMHTVMLQNRQVFVGVSTVVGKRKEQQDAVKADSSFTYAENGRMIAVLCDGMGGMSGGERASRICASTVHKAFHEMPKTEAVSQFYRNVINRADDEVAALRAPTGALLKAGTTLVSVVIEGDNLHWASVGDSRIYLLRGNDIACITKDHNYLMLLMEKVRRREITMEAAQRDPKREALVSYIGMGGVRYVDINSRPFQLLDGDTIILCSDGLYRTVTEEEIRRTIAESHNNIAEAGQKLTSLALSKNNPHQDNTSVIVLRFCKDG